MTVSSQFDNFNLQITQIPEEWEDARVYLYEFLRQVNNQINIRTVGFHLEQPILTGNLFTASATSVERRNVFRTLIDTGALPNAGTTTTAHGITFDANFTLVDLWLAATDPVNFLAFGLSYWSVAAADITLNMDATNI